MKIRIDSILKLLLILTTSILCVLFFSRHVPFEMDEFACYQGLNSFLYPLNQLNAFRESFTQYHLAPFGNVFLPLRSNLYVGTFPGLLYFPLFKLWPSPDSARLLGLLMLSLQAFLISRIFKTELLLSFFALVLFMPYAFQHIVDTGPVSFQTTSIFLLVWLTRHWSDALGKGDKSSWRYPLAMGLIIFLCVWAKLTYFFMLPAISILILYCLVPGRNDLMPRLKTRIVWRDLLILFSAAAVPSLVLLNSNQRWDMKYYTVMTSFALAARPDLPSSPTHLWQIAKYFTDPLLAAHRVFTIEDKVTALGIMFWMPVIALICLGIKYLRARKEKIGYVVLNLSLFLMTLCIMSLSPSAWAMHHVVLAFPFLILTLAEIGSKLSSKKTLLILAALFLALNLSAYARLPKLEPGYFDHPSKVKMNDLLNRKFADGYVFVVIDFGMYYIKALYGNKDQCVLYIEPLNKSEQIDGIKEILARLGRKAVFIALERSESDLDLVRREFPRLNPLQTDIGTGNWRIWYEK